MLLQMRKFRMVVQICKVLDSVGWSLFGHASFGSVMWKRK
jgi:hypothetical protein